MRHNFIINDTKILRLYFGNGKYLDIDFFNQHSCDVYIKFINDLKEKKQCEIKFNEDVEFFFDETDLYIISNFNAKIINNDMNYVLNLFNEIVNNL